MSAQVASAGRTGYPRQFWVLFTGMLISTIGSSMIWPFMMIYVTERLHLPLSQATLLTSLNAAVGLVFSFLAGPVADRLGRKGVMVISLLGNGLGYLALSRAETFWEFALVMGLQGAFNPLYRVGGDAMTADLIVPEKRVNAYSLLRMSNNLGIAIGPAIGGWVASSSYAVAFYFAAAGLLTYGLLLLILARETLPAANGPKPAAEPFGGYGAVLRDGHFVRYVASFVPTSMCAAMVWVLLSVYTKQNYGLPERLYGFIPVTNALMVVFLQYLVTMFTRRRSPLWMVTLGAFLYALGGGSVAWMSGFWGFWLSMVIMTFGELIAVPTSSTYVANLAPVDKRGRYMGLYGLTWTIASMFGPLLGGQLSDAFAPRFIWYGAGVIGLISVFAFAAMALRNKPRPVAA
ncbi:MAG: MFS transporter [Longilinea sp.]|nr:MFS transporter [Longilinea sp.]